MLTTIIYTTKKVSATWYKSCSFCVTIQIIVKRMQILHKNNKQKNQIQKLIIICKKETFKTTELLLLE